VRTGLAGRVRICARPGPAVTDHINAATGHINRASRARDSYQALTKLFDQGSRIRAKEAALTQEIGREQVRRLMAEGAQVVDVLPAQEYGEDHLPGAINLPLRKIEADATRVLDPSRPVIVYCWDSA